MAALGWLMDGRHDKKGLGWEEVRRRIRER